MVPLSTDSAVFNGSAVNGAETVSLSAATGIAGLTFANTGTTLLNSTSVTAQALTIGTGGITINSGAGAVTIGNATNAVPITLSGAQSWTNNASTLFTVVNALTTGGNQLTIGGTANTTISGVISGTGSLVLNGTTGGGPLVAQTPTLTLTAANTYSGGTTINGGMLSMVGGNNAALGTGTVTINGGDFLFGDGKTLTNNFVLNGGGIYSLRGH